MNEHDNSPRGRSGAMLMASLAVVAGTLLFLPTILETISPPFVAEILLPIFWILAPTSLFILGLCVYLVRFTTRVQIPHVMMGIGSFLSLATLAVFGFYVGLNLTEDRTSLPTIVSIDISPMSPRAGQTIRFGSETYDQDYDSLNFTWLINGTEIGDADVQYWTSPNDGGKFELTLVVNDGNPNRSVEESVEFFIEQPFLADSGNACQILQRGLLSSLQIIERQNTTRFTKINGLYERHGTPCFIAYDLSKDTDLTAYMFVEGAFLRASDLLSDLEMEALFEAEWRPCCSDYPGIWPLCRRDC